MTNESTIDVTGAPPVRSSAWLGRIVCGDNTEVLSGFPDACIDLVVTSPPYDDLRTYGGHSWNFETLAEQLVRVLKPGGVIVWVVADATVNGSETLTSMRQAIHFKDVCGLNVHDTMIYESDKPPMNGNRFQACWEYMFVLSRGNPKTWNPIMETSKQAGVKRCNTTQQRQKDGTMKPSTIRIVQPMRVMENAWRVWNKSSRGIGHPAPFPIEIPSRHIQAWSNPGDVILDPFAGSGTTLKAAKELNRLWCGIEINPEYCAMAEARLSQDVLQLETCAMRPNDPSSATRRESASAGEQAP